LLARPLQMRAWAVDACTVRHVGDVQISRPRTGNHRSHLDDHASAHVLDAAGIGELRVVDRTVHAIDDQIDWLTHLVACQTLVDYAADDRLR
jgi:hypothetical protein